MPKILTNPQIHNLLAPRDPLGGPEALFKGSGGPLTYKYYFPISGINFDIQHANNSSNLTNSHFRGCHRYIRLWSTKPDNFNIRLPIEILKIEVQVFACDPLLWQKRFSNYTLTYPIWGKVWNFKFSKIPIYHIIFLIQSVYWLVLNAHISSKNYFIMKSKVNFLQFLS